MEQARELVDVLQGLEEWSLGADWMRPVPNVALNDHQVALIYSVVLLALVQKTESTLDRWASHGTATCATLASGHGGGARGGSGPAG